MIAKIFLVTSSGFAFGALMMALGNRNVSGDVARERWKKLLVYFLIVHTALALTAGGSITTFILVVTIITIGASELGRATEIPGFGPRWHSVVTWIIFTLVAAMTVIMVPTLSASSWVYLYLLVAVFDGFSQVIGQLAGRHKLAPRISPGKTVEGSIGGLLAAVLVGHLFSDLVWPHEGSPLLLIVAIAAAGLCGDLAASWVKRRAGIKDYGTILPGQGGVLDRFDSFLAASAIAGPIVHLVGTA